MYEMFMLGIEQKTQGKQGFYAQQFAYQPCRGKTPTDAHPSTLEARLTGLIQMEWTAGLGPKT